MKRLAAVLLTAVVVVSCQDAPSPLNPPSTGPSSAIFDGSDESGNPYFFFRSPLVEDPIYSGVFNGALATRIEVCELDLGSDPDGWDATCVPGDPVLVVESADIGVGTDAYQYTWHTDFDQTHPDNHYRLSVWVGEEQLGYRDLDPAYPSEDVPSGQKKLAFYTYRVGSSIPVKYTPLIGALCSEGVRFCDECVVHTGDTFCKPDLGLGIRVIEQSEVPEGTVISITRDETCAGSFNPTSPHAQGRVDYLTQLDLPQFGGCFELEAIDPNGNPITTTLPTGYIVGLCVENKAFDYLEGTGQLDLINIHRAPVRTGSAIQALPNVDPGNLVDCDEYAMVLNEMRVPESLRWAYRGLRTLDTWVNPLNVKPLYATHSGFGGKGKEFSYMDWAIPAEMDAAAGTQNQLAPTGQPVPNDPTVVVIDEEAGGVEYARVTFSLDAGNGALSCPGTGDCSVVSSTEVVVRTDAQGEGSVVWTMPATDGSYTLVASGLGIAGPGDGGPFTDGHTTSGGSTNPIDLGVGTVTFTATACSPGSGFGTATIDGTMSPGEWDACSGPPGDQGKFLANISGGDTPAQVFFMRDNDYLYLALMIERDGTEKANTVTIFLDDDEPSSPDHGLSVGDDMIDFNALTGVVTDLHVVDKCKKGQSFCGDANEPQNIVDAEFGVNSPPGEQTFYFYEMQLSLESGDPLDIAVDSFLQAFWIIRLGNGAQGNTQFPDYGEYLQLIPTLVIP